MLATIPAGYVTLRNALAEYGTGRQQEAVLQRCFHVVLENAEWNMFQLILLKVIKISSNLYLYIGCIIIFCVTVIVVL